MRALNFWVKYQVSLGQAYINKIACKSLKRNKFTYSIPYTIVGQVMQIMVVIIIIATWMGVSMGMRIIMRLLIMSPYSYGILHLLYIKILLLWSALYLVVYNDLVTCKYYNRSHFKGHVCQVLCLSCILFWLEKENENPLKIRSI